MIPVFVPSGQGQLQQPGSHTYATWNPSDKAAGTILSNGNLTAQVQLSDAVRSTISKSAGKWYWELTINSTNCGGGVATSGASLSSNTYAPNPGAYADSSGNRTVNGSASGTTFTMANGDILGIALDAGGNTISYYKNNVLQGTADTISSGTYFAWAGGPGSSAGTLTANFGATALTYTPPSGYNAGLYT